MLRAKFGRSPTDRVRHRGCIPGRTRAVRPGRAGCRGCPGAPLLRRRRTAPAARCPSRRPRPGGQYTGPGRQGSGGRAGARCPPTPGCPAPSSPSPGLSGACAASRSRSGAGTVEADGRVSTTWNDQQRQGARHCPLRSISSARYQCASALPMGRPASSHRRWARTRTSSPQPGALSFDSAALRSIPTVQTPGG